MPWYLIVMYFIWVAGCLATIDEEIAQKFEQISKLWRNTRTKVKVNRFIELLVICDEDVSHFMNNN